VSAGYSVPAWRAGACTLVHSRHDGKRVLHGQDSCRRHSTFRPWSPVRSALAELGRDHSAGRASRDPPAAGRRIGGARSRCDIAREVNSRPSRTDTTGGERAWARRQARRPVGGERDSDIACSPTGPGRPGGSGSRARLGRIRRASGRVRRRTHAASERSLPAAQAAAGARDPARPPRPATRARQPPAAQPAAATIAVVWISTW
jgi:hypothetical protein